MASRMVTIAVIVIVLVIGFAGGYMYSSLTSQPTTKTVVFTTPVEHRYTETETVTLTSIETLTTFLPTELSVTQTVTQTFYSTFTKEMATTITYTVVGTVTKTVAQATQIVLSYPSKPSAELDLNGDGVTDLFAEVNPWNLNSYKGVQQMVIDLIKREFRTEINITDANPRQWTNGYPEIYIGRKPWGGRYANGFGVPFPMKISNMTPFTISFYICVERIDPSMPFNIAADAWIVRESVALKPATAPAKGDVEIMVWVYRQNLSPAGRKVGEVTIPIVINGTRTNATFEVWRHDSVEWGGWQYIAFAPKGWGVKCGQIAYDPTLFVQTAKNYATFNITDYYLLDWEIGTEWGTMSSNGAA
ncbi:MAG: endoglucanase, partial [Ignisphaera sp.]